MPPFLPLFLLPFEGTSGLRSTCSLAAQTVTTHKACTPVTPLPSRYWSHSPVSSPLPAPWASQHCLRTDTVCFGFGLRAGTAALLDDPEINQNYLDFFHSPMLSWLLWHQWYQKWLKFKLFKVFQVKLFHRGGNLTSTVSNQGRLCCKATSLFKPQRTLHIVEVIHKASYFDEFSSPSLRVEANVKASSKPWVSFIPDHALSDTENLHNDAAKTDLLSI